MSMFKKCMFHIAGDNILCNLHIAAAAYELLVESSYINSRWGNLRQTDDDDEGRTTDDDLFNFFCDCYWYLMD